jgi:large subunit ribosomal protein L18
MLTKYERRKFRTRNQIIKSNKSDRPRIVVSRSNKNIYAQLVDIKGNVLTSYSTINAEISSKTSGIDKAKLVGQEFAKLCLKKDIIKVVFDKGAYAYGGRVKAIAEACREGGLQF